jgi:DNA-binding NarL/FixJ family response regulator
VLVVAGPNATARAAIDILHRPPSELTVVMVTDDWVIEKVSAGIVGLVGWRADQWQGRPLLGEMHPADVAAFCDAVLHAAQSDGGVALEARLRDASASWRAVTIGVITSPSNNDLPAIVLTLSPSLASSLASEDQEWRRWATLSDGLDAAAVTIRNLLADGMPDIKLSERQVEIVARLLRGERVPTAAAAMNLSQSTLRTHLSAVFQKFGVNSQEELLRSVRGSLDGPSNNFDTRRPIGGGSP